MPTRPWADARHGREADGRPRVRHACARMAHCLIVAPMVASGAPVLRDVLTSALDAVLSRPNVLGLPSRRRVVVLLVDGLGHEALSARAGHARTLTGTGRRRIATGAPTTTAAALTTLSTGVDPGVHGVVGFSALDPAADRVVNQLRGFDADLPDGWQRTGTVFERATAEGVAADGKGLTRARCLLKRHEVTGSARKMTIPTSRSIIPRSPGCSPALRTGATG